MAGIVAVTRFCQANGAAFSSYINYIDRENAARRDNLDKFDLFSNYVDAYMDDSAKAAKERPEQISNLFTKDSDILSAKEKDSLKSAFQRAQENGSNLWQTVISFDNEYLAQHGFYDAATHSLNAKRLMVAARKSIGAMLEREGLENAVWAASFHYNTDNIHIHIATVEPTPMRELREYRKWERNEDGKLKMRVNPSTGKRERIPLLDRDGKQIIEKAYKGTFKQKSIDCLKSVLRQEIETDKQSTIQITNLLRGIVSGKREQDLMTDPVFQKRMQDLYSAIKASGTNRKYWNYNQGSFGDIRAKIDEISKEYINTYHREGFDKLVAEIEKQSASYAESYGGSNNYLDSKLYDGKDGLYTRLGNAILKEIQHYDKDRQLKIKAAKDAYDLLSSDLAEGVKTLEALSDKGNTFAQNRLALFYLKDEFGYRDQEMAKFYFEKAARSGDLYSKEMLERLNSGKRFEAQTAKIFDGSCGRDLSKAARMLKRSMRDTYDNWSNQRAYEILQHEIEARGQDNDIDR